jgi:lipopolysaccharide/colanic/teichoic acid biosynthesis glycosyltransferase
MAYRILKRIFDLIVAIPATILALIPLLAIAIIIRTTSKGSAVFKQERAGKNGKPFTMYKFRTMRTDVDPFGASPKSGTDPRLTKIGIFLREYSLDELPQLFNVLLGNMTLVGPRPLYIAQMAEWDDTQKRRLLVKPGVTGLAQISGRGQLTREAKLALDVKYVDTASMTGDIKIIFTTFMQIVAKQDIYEDKYSENQETRDDE